MKALVVFFTASAAGCAAGDSGKPAPCPDPGTWRTVASTHDPRESPGAILLDDGRVLVAGGHPLDAGFEYIDSTEIFDSVQGIWTTAGPLVQARSNGIWNLARLESGNVILAGEHLERVSVEVFDAGTATWSSTGQLNVGRGIHVTETLDDGRVLVAGGIDYDANLIHASAEVYDVGLGTWSMVSPMAGARFKQAHAKLADGRVLVAGGTAEEPSAGNPLASAELFDPATNTWSSAGAISVAREGLHAIRLTDGRVLVTGGATGSFGAYQLVATSDLFDPQSGTWTVAASMLVARGGTPLVLLPDGRVLATGGGNPSGGGAQRTAELYDPETDRWCSAGEMAKGRRLHRAVLLPNGEVLVIGGYAATQMRDVEIYTPGPR